MLETFREVGLLAWPILAAGALGSLAAVVALILAARSRWGSPPNPRPSRRAPSAVRVAIAATYPIMFSPG